MKFERIVIFGDFHGDLDTMLASLADKGLIRYGSHELDGIIVQIKASLNVPYSSSLETIVRPQAQPVRVIFLGDFLDRYDKGYHIIQFLEKIRWKKFGIDPIFLWGNHDLFNFHFFINPYEMADIYQGCGHSKSSIVSYINGMGLDKSLNSFKALHGEEIFKRQEQFYETGTLEYQEACYSLQYKYPCDLSPLVKYCHLADDSYMAYYNKIVTEFGLDLDKGLEERGTNCSVDLSYYLFNLLGKMTKGQRNWWDISHYGEVRENCYSRHLSDFNLFTNEASEILPVDWRVISLVWRHHYGHFFRRLKLLHNEGTTLFVHGGISPLAMVDPLVFGNLYDPRKGTFKQVRSKYNNELSLDKLINRDNRLITQLVENALNDYSFGKFSGMEIVDQMGYCRGVADGFPIFGGPIWSDFEYIQKNVKEHKRLLLLYKAFKEATGIERIICGHTPFYIRDKPHFRFVKNRELQAIGLEYLCIDNGCSKGYRKKPILNGIEINQADQILDPGDFFSS
jgi:hypothetical protein